MEISPLTPRNVRPVQYLKINNIYPAAAVAAMIYLGVSRTEFLVLVMEDEG